MGGSPSFLCFSLCFSLLYLCSSLLLSRSSLLLPCLTPHTSHTLPVGLVGMLREVGGSPIRSWHLARRPPKGFGARSDKSLSPPCVCVRNRRGRAVPLLPLPHPLLTYAYSVKYDDWLKSEEPDLFCLCVIRHRPCSQLSCNSMGIAAGAFRTSRSVGCRLYLHRSRRTWRERRDCIVAQERCR